VQVLANEQGWPAKEVGNELGEDAAQSQFDSRLQMAAKHGQ
jgi:hypothetical protein